MLPPMRIRLILLAFCAFAVALPAAAAKKPPDITVVRPVLRGAQPAPPAEPEPPPPAITAPGNGYSLVQPGYAAAAAPDSGQCRVSCSRSYYFCAASEEPADCASTWTQCTSRCRAPGY